MPDKSNGLKNDRSIAGKNVFADNKKIILYSTTLVKMSKINYISLNHNKLIII